MASTTEGGSVGHFTHTHTHSLSPPLISPSMSLSVSVSVCLSLSLGHSSEQDRLELLSDRWILRAICKKEEESSVSEANCSPQKMGQGKKKKKKKNGRKITKALLFSLAEICFKCNRREFGLRTSAIKAGQIENSWSWLLVSSSVHSICTLRHH